MAEGVRDVHLGFTFWTQKVFVAAVHGASIGLKLQPKERPRTEGLSNERLRESEDLVDESSPGITRDTLAELLHEVRRLRSIDGRGKSDSQGGPVRRRTDEERQLRAIAARILAKRGARPWWQRDS